MRLVEVAQIVEDLFYQDYPPGDSFIDKALIMRLVAVSYSKMINDDFKTQKLLTKASVGFSFVEISQSWLKHETVEVKKIEDGCWEAELCENVFPFDFDALGQAIQKVNITGGGSCGELIRISYSDLWEVCYAPVDNKIYLYLYGKNKIRFANIKDNCKPKDLDVQYVPEVRGDNQEAFISDTKIDEIYKDVLQAMLIAKQQVVVKMSNDSNLNTTLPTEVDKNLT